ncbi:carboxyl-terminal protease [Nitzschia inconspicua]|uniref:Carboxyl-terminal protease n=1 Tax=Nitzschia inconspicua TaxID=303405 RepID=A0A9K3PTC0_9STRA|nr:carboxyl-terminal protease [Nitzschia inconspicua]
MLRKRVGSLVLFGIVCVWGLSFVCWSSAFSSHWKRSASPTRNRNRCHRSFPSQRHIQPLCLWNNEIYGNKEKRQSRNHACGKEGAPHERQRIKADVALSIAMFFFSGNLFFSAANAQSLETPPQSLSSSTVQTNIALIDYAVGTINTQYYDNSGGAWFNPKDFYLQWKTLQHAAEELEMDTIAQQHQQASRQFSQNGISSSSASTTAVPKSLRNANIPKEALQLDTREGTIQALKWLVGSLQDPYSKYMTREELKYEYHGAHDGFLGTGAFVEAPTSRNWNRDRFLSKYEVATTTITSSSFKNSTPMSSSNNNNNNSNKHHPQKLLSSTRVSNLPVVTAVAPNSPAERAGLVVGDRIVAIGDRDFLGWTRPDIAKTLRSQYNAETYLGVADLTIAKPIYAVQQEAAGCSTNGSTRQDRMLPVASSVSPSLPLIGSSSFFPREFVLGYRATKLHLPTKAYEPSFLAWPKSSASIGTSSVAAGISTSTSHGDPVVQYELLTSSSGSIFDHLHSNDVLPDDYKVGYIRLTRFSKLATEGFQQAVQTLEDAGAQSYIIDLRNNYGGIIQEAMLTASSLLRDPHAILCYTLNARGGFTPVDVEQYVVDPRYPGYLLSKESKAAVLQQVQREHPAMFRERSGKIDWDPPSSYASIHEQVTKRGIRRISYVNDQLSELQEQQVASNSFLLNPALRQELLRRKDLVILINEGTASSAEFFTAALHDNGRTVAVVGTKSYGKGLIQHTFPMPDGGGLKLTVGEFLRPSLQHVTNVFDARFDHETGEMSGGGIRPDIYCDGRQGIPGKPSADLCVGVALDVLEETAQSWDWQN